MPCLHAYDVSVINMRLDMDTKQENFSFLLIIIPMRIFANCNTTAYGQSKNDVPKHDYIRREGNQNV